MADQKLPTLELLLGLLACKQDNTAIDEAQTSLTLLTRAKASMERVLGSLLDPASFYLQYVPTRYDFAEGLKRAYLQIKKDCVGSRFNALRGAIGLVCFTLELLGDVGCDAPPSFSVRLEWPRELLCDPAVQDWFYDIYKPSLRRNPSVNQNVAHSQQEIENLDLSQKYWRELDYRNLELYRIGTTSFILRCRVKILAGERLVLKCLLFPYTRIAHIADATRDYALNYGAGVVPATSRVRSSTDRWILMDFVEGLTLQEVLQEQRCAEKKEPPFLRTDLLISIGKPLFDVLCALSNAGFRHEDLTPSNIIIVFNLDRTIEKVVLIDLGRNHLYTRKTGIAENREALFVAPEVRNGHSIDTSDLYSFGMLLIELADPRGVQSLTISESIYQYAPQLARFIEDLIDINPEKRLLIFRPKGKKDLYLNLHNIFTDELKVLPPYSEVQSGLHLTVQQIKALFFPSDLLSRQRKLWQITRSSKHPEIVRHSGWLYGWSILCTLQWNVLFTICILWGLLRDFRVGDFPTYISIVQRYVFRCDSCVPILDWFRASNYHIGDVLANLPARLTIFSVMAQTKYYQNILAGLTTRPMKGALAYITEATLRYCAIASLVPVFICNIYQPRWWLILLASGFIIAGINNVLCYWLATRTLNSARGVLSTIPPSDDHPLQAFGSWGPVMFAYIIFLLCIWVGLQAHFLHDEFIYMIATTIISVVTLCITKCIYLAPSVRGSLSRAFTAGERLKAVAIYCTPETLSQKVEEKHLGHTSSLLSQRTK